MAYVYRHIRLDKNEPFYIGIGSDISYKRAKEKTRRNEIWNKIVNKTPYEVEIIFDNIGWDEAKIKEAEFIKMYGRIDLKNGTLSNMTDGGDGTINKVFNYEYRKKLSESAKRRVISDSQREKLREYRKGIKNSPEARKKISAKMKGRKPSEKCIKICKERKGDKNPAYGVRGKMNKLFKGYIQAYKNNLLIGEYEGINDCAKSLGVCPSKISAALNGRRNHTKGYTFKRTKQ